MTVPAIQRSILLFWAIWFGVVTSTNVCDALVAMGLLPPDWPYASGNFGLIAQVTSRYSPPSFLLGALFAGVIAWEGLACGLFLRAWSAWRVAADRGRAAARLAYALAIALWAAFLIVDELFIAYDVSGTHLNLFIAHVVCLTALALAGGSSDDGYREA